MKSVSREYQANIIEAFNSTSRYLDDLQNLDNVLHFGPMVDQIYPAELQLNKAYSSGIEAPFFIILSCQVLRIRLHYSDSWPHSSVFIQLNMSGDKTSTVGLTN